MAGFGDNSANDRDASYVSMQFILSFSVEH